MRRRYFRGHASLPDLSDGTNAIIVGPMVPHNSERLVDHEAVTRAEVFAGLAVTYGTPLLVIDEPALRAAMRRFTSAFTREGWTASVTYAGKALLVRAIARIAHEEGLALDVCSLGEFETALRAGVPAADCIVHGCWKTKDELDAAVANGARHVVVDHRAEINQLAARAESAGARVDVLVRVNPGIS